MLVRGGRRFLVCAAKTCRSVFRISGRLCINRRGSRGPGRVLTIRCGIRKPFSFELATVFLVAIVTDVQPSFVFVHTKLEHLARRELARLKRSAIVNLVNEI